MVMHRRNVSLDDAAFAGRCEICGEDIAPALDPYPTLLHVNQHLKTHDVNVTISISGVPLNAAQQAEKAERLRASEARRCRHA